MSTLAHGGKQPVFMNLRVSFDFRCQVKAEAARRGVSVAEFCIQAITARVKKSETRRARLRAADQLKADPGQDKATVTAAA